MILLVSVVSIREDHLLVFDLTQHRQLQVNTRSAARFRAGDLLRIEYSGALTKSVPPQLTPLHIAKLSSADF